MKLRTKITVIAIIVMSLGVKSQQTYNENVNINGSLFVGNNPGSNGEIIHVRNPQATGTNQSFGGIKFSSAPGFDWVLGKFSDGNTGKFQIRDQANTERFTILPSGYVGIGTSTPKKKFHVYTGNSGAEPFSSASAVIESGPTGLLQILTNNTGVGGIMIGDPESPYAGYIRYSHSDNSMKFYTASTPQFIIKENGDVGIGTDGPVSKLHIKGKGITSSTEAFRVDNSANGFALVVRDDYQIYSRLQTIGTGYAGKSAPTNGLLVEGNVGIGTENTMGFKLAVKGKIGAGEIEVKSPDYWPDYVFSSNYNLKPLTEVETFIEENNHLPDIPSEKEVKEKGINLGDMDAKLLQKIEELTLYMIEQNKKTEALIKKNQELQERIEELENK